jgi:hypothetical protein
MSRVRVQALSRPSLQQRVDLVAAGLPVARIAADLGITDRTIYAIGAFGVGQASVGAQPN